MATVAAEEDCRIESPGVAGLSFEYLGRQLQRAALYSSAKIPGGQLREILDLAARASGLATLDLTRLRDACDQGEVTLTGVELRYVLVLALQAKQTRTRPVLLRVVSCDQPR